MSMKKGNEDSSKFLFRVLKTFDFDGLIVEVMEKVPESSNSDADIQQPLQPEIVDKHKALPKIISDENRSSEDPEEHLICALCLNVIAKDNEVILRNCQDSFCRACLISEIIDNESDVIKCPTKYSNCDTVIQIEEIKSIIGDDNFQILRINRLDKKFNSLVVKDETEFQSILESFDPLASLPHEGLINGNIAREDLFLPETDSGSFDNFDVHAARGSTMDNLESKTYLNQFIKQERYEQEAPTSSRFVVDQDDTLLGAAGLWARKFEHHSFRGNASPPVVSIKSEPQQYSFQDPVIAHKPPVLITNQDEFVCSICEMFVIEEQGVVLKNCAHSFCRGCLIDSIQNTNKTHAHCPMVIENCGIEINDDEIQALLTPDDYHKYLETCHNKSLKEHEDNLLNKSTVPALLDLENYDYIENRVNFVCAICLTDQEPGEGIMLKNCLHEYCKRCLGRTIEMSDELEVPCPFVAEDGTHCEGVLQDRELRSLISPEVYSQHLAKSLIRAEAVIESFHCQTANCNGWAEKGEGATQFHCPLCHKTNCIKCVAVHEGKSCEDYFYEINADARKARDQQLTVAQEEQLIARQEAMRCPGCGVVIQKTEGCNHMTCSRCRREFQWLGRQ